MKKELEAAYFPSGFYQSIPETFPDFQAYREHCKQGITFAKSNLNSPDFEKVISANMPFELLPPSESIVKSRKGIILLHGLYDSPCIMRSLGDYFVNQGFKVRAILLPGHGTVPGDLLEITYLDWLAQASYGVESLKGEVEELYLGGFSTGGLLSIYLALMTPELLKGLFLFAPSLELTSSLNYIARFNKRLSIFLPAPHWLTIEKELDYAKYQSFCVNSLLQVYKLKEKVKEMFQTKKLISPSFWVLTGQDEVLSSQKIVKVFNEKATSSSKLIYYSPKEKQFSDKRIQWRTSQIKNKNIKNFSHVSLPVAPDHFHYGEQGDYIETIENELNKKTKHFGSSRNIKLSNPLGPTRLTYNPDFPNLMEAMTEWLGIAERALAGNLK